MNRYPLVTEEVLQSVKAYCAGEKEELLKWVKKIHGDICTSPLTQIELSLDGDLMEYTRNTLEHILSPLTKKNVTNGAVYIIDTKTGKILTYIGSRQSSTK